MKELDLYLAANPDLKRALDIAAAGDPTNGRRSDIFVWAVVALSALTVSAIVTLAIARPDNSSTGTIILGITLPAITAFLAKAVQEVHLAVNGRLSELLKLTAKASHAEGQLAEQSAHQSAVGAP